MRKITKERMGTNFSFYITNEQMERLEEVHWRERKSVSEIVREAIDEYLMNHVEGNKTFSLEKWQENPEFKAIPTLMSPEDRWDKYIHSCNDKELTKIAIANTKVKKLIESRRAKEFKAKNSPMNNFRRG